MLDIVNGVLEIIIDSNEKMLSKMQINSDYMKGYADGVKLVLKDVKKALDVLSKKRG